MAKFRVGILHYCGGGVTTQHYPPWIIDTYTKMREDPRIGPGNVLLWQMNDTPIDMVRNKSLLDAEEAGCDFVLMLDNDMMFDLPYKNSKPFWDVAWPFALEHNGPCVIAAPYCGPPPVECVYVFRFENSQSDNLNPDFKLLAYSRHEASKLTGIQRCGALPTGLMLIDMRAVKRLSHPRFYYEWTDATHSAKASTEDVTFSRDLTYAGVPLYCAWDSWAGHLKTKIVGKPQEIPPDLVPAWMVNAAQQTGVAELDNSLSAWKEKPVGDYLLSPKPDKVALEKAKMSAMRVAFDEYLLGK